MLVSVIILPTLCHASLSTLARFLYCLELPFLVVYVDPVHLCFLYTSCTVHVYTHARMRSGGEVRMRGRSVLLPCDGDEQSGVDVILHRHRRLPLRTGVRCERNRVQRRLAGSSAIALHVGTASAAVVFLAVLVIE